MYIEAECPKIIFLYLCKKPINYIIQEKPDCITHLIKIHEIDKSCKTSHVILKDEAVEQLDEKHYILSFPNPTKVKIFCAHEGYKTVQGSFLITIPVNCNVKTPSFTIENSNDHVKGYAINIIELPTTPDQRETKTSAIVLNSINLQKLHSINSRLALQTPVELNKVNDNIIYHTTIPIYLILIIASVLGFGIAYKRFWLKTSKNTTPHK